MYYPHLIACILTLFVSAPLRAQEGDSPETLRWVANTAKLIEDRLTSAINMTDEPNLLIRLMESSTDFEAVALAGLYCHEARTAAELGRNYCNWLNTYTRDKDLNALIQRAQDARRQATRMHDAAAVCLQVVKQQPPDITFTLADVIRSNAEMIDHDLADGLAAQNFHILSQKIEHAERLFHETGLLTQRLNQCEALHLATEAGIKACMDALAAPNWTLVTTHVQTAANWAAQIKAGAESCQ